MKFTPLKISVLSLTLIACLTSCQKKEESINPGEKLSLMTLNAPNANGIDVVTFSTSVGEVKMLHFTSWMSFEQTAQELNDQVDQLEDAFVSANSGLSDDALNGLLDSLGLVFNAPLIGFENLYGFDNSYRKVFDTEMDNWLGHADLDLVNSPKRKTLFSHAELSLLNNYQQVMVGDSVYHFTADGYAIIAGQYDEAVDFVITNPKATRFEGRLQLTAWWIFTDEPDCKLWIKRDKDAFETSNRKIIVATGIRSLMVYCKVVADVDSYEKKNGKWKSYSTDLGVVVTADLRNINCTPAGPFQNSGWKNKKKKSLSNSKTEWGTDPDSGSSYRARKGVGLIGQYNYHGTGSNYTLTW